MFPLTYREVYELVRREVLHTKLARAIMRKSGFTNSSQTFGAPSTHTILRSTYWSQIVRNSPRLLDTEPIQFSRDLRRQFNVALGAGQTQPLTPFGFYGQQVWSMTRVWLGSATEMRIVARVFQDAPNARIFAVFSLPTYFFLNNARTPDTYELVPSTGTTPSTPQMVPFVGPFAVSPWVPIHENFLQSEVMCSVYLRNLATSGTIQRDLGIFEVQVR